MQPYVADASNAHQATLRLYQYIDHCALVGRFQNINAELDLESCDVQCIQYGRRQTGGGAIIMGRDQLGLCVTCASNTFEWTNIRDLCYLFSKPVIAALSSFGIHAEFRAKNDLEVDGKKIAGLGVYIDPHGAIQFHLSLLLDLDILKMLSVLQIPIQKYSDKRKINAVSQRMATVTGLLGRQISQEEIRVRICQSFEEHFNVEMATSSISDEENKEISRLISEKYATEDWIQQQTPQEDLTGMSLKKTSAGLLRIYIGLKGEIIKSVLITGDFIEHEQLFKQIEAELKWSPFDKEQILKTIQAVFKRNELPLEDFSTTIAEAEQSAPTIEKLNIEMQNSNSASKITNTELHNTNPASHIPHPESIADAIFLAAQKAYNANEHTYQGTCYYPKRKETEALNKSTV
jgi:lipoate-protein ligase A